MEERGFNNSNIKLIHYLIMMGREEQALYLGEGLSLDQLKEIVGITEGAEDLVANGGPGSGNFGHKGRPGLVGGSGSGGKAYDANTADNAKYKRLVAKHKEYYKDADINPVLFYASTGSFIHLNGALRNLGYEGALAKTPHMLESRDGKQATYREVITGMDALIAKGKTKVDMTVVRAAKIPKSEMESVLSKKMLTDKGYVSTAASILTQYVGEQEWSLASRFYSMKNPRQGYKTIEKAQATYDSLPPNEKVEAYFNIKVPKGSTGLMVDALPGIKDKLPTESEFILPRGSSFRVTDVEMQSTDAVYYTRVNPMFIINVELIQ